MKNITDKIDSFVASYKTSQQKLIEEGKLLFTDTTKEIFEVYPELKEFNWTQYTPYFNDGDICTFEVRFYPDEDSVILEKNNRRKEIEEVLETLVNSIPEKILENLFGDGYSVRITRTGVETEEYSHD